MRRRPVLLVPIGVAVVAAADLWYLRHPVSIEVPEPRRSIGRVARGSVLKVEFKFRTSGIEAAATRLQSAGCGCAVVIAPSATDANEGFVQLRVDTFALPDGQHTKEVTLVLDGGRAPPVSVALAFAVVSEVVVRPALVDFGEVERGVPSRQDVTATVEELSNGVQITGVALEDSPSFVAVPTRYGPQRYTVRVEVKSTAESGFHFGTVVLKTSSTVMPAIRIPIRAQVR